MSIRSVLLAGASAASLIISSAAAGPYRDAEAAIATVYAEYRTALFQTNGNNQALAVAALESFRAKWLALSRQWTAAPPPQYADDLQFGQTIGEVTNLADKAASSALSGDLAKSHEVLEGIRDALSGLRFRNGILVFSDRMNAYHAHLEHVLENKYPTLTDLGEDAAILDYLARDLERHRPQGVDKAAFDQALGALNLSIAALRQAVRAGDATAVENARKGLKPPYARMFLRFG
jgi:hypothetical protein